LDTIPICTGTGLLALDVILNNNLNAPPKLHAGGSCGNVLTILSYLGWKSFPIARLAKDDASNELISDLQRWRVNTGLIFQKKEGSTPIIIHRILKDREGKPKHKFEFRNPTTGAWLPGYKPVIAKDVAEITKNHPKADVFYFDRINRASIELAKFNKNNGALIVLEPSSIGDIKLFKEAIEISHIFKFSKDRIKNYNELFPIQQAFLEIETLGKEGLRYRFDKTKKAKKWKFIESFKLDENLLIDSAGAGDWCTAGIINSLGENGASSFYESENDDIESALEFGQALGAINCCYDGARGAMYNNDRSFINDIITCLKFKGRFNSLMPKSSNTMQISPYDNQIVSLSSYLL
jgi:sugar/nucleoside kinase (ribokinase family)